MAKEMNKSELLPGRFYYLSNHGAGNKNIFFRTSHYNIFIGKYCEYLSEYIDTYAYCLLPDQFHILMRTRPLQLFDNGNNINNQLRKFFISYSLTVNNQLGRKGSIFSKYMGREEIMNTESLKNLVGEIHYLPLLHGLTDTYFTYRFSSFKALIVPCKTRLMKKEVINWFCGLEALLDYHRELARNREVAVA